MTCREMSRTTKEPCGKPLPCADHSTPTNAPESAGGEEQRRFLADACLWLKNLVTTNDEDAEMRNRLQTFVHAAHISTPAAPQPETEGMTVATVHFDEMQPRPWRINLFGVPHRYEWSEMIANTIADELNANFAAWTAAKGGR